MTITLRGTGERPRDNGTVEQRFTRLSEAYFGSIASLLEGLRSQGEGPPSHRGPVGSPTDGAGGGVRRPERLAGVLGAFTMSIAPLNLRPLPPLDGFATPMCLRLRSKTDGDTASLLYDASTFTTLRPELLQGPIDSTRVDAAPLGRW